MSLDFEGSHLAVLDLGVIVGYAVLIICVGIWSSWRREKGTVSGYFLAARNMHWIPVGASLFASNVGSGHFIGLAGSAAAGGVAVAGFETGAVYIMMLLGWIFVPVYTASGIYTTPEYLKERFGGQRIRIYMAMLSLILYVFTKISAELYAGALFIQMALNKNSPEWLYISVLILLAMSAVFTIAGGLNAVIWTDFIQTILMMIGAWILAGITYYKINGFAGLIEQYPYAVATIQPPNTTCGHPPSDFLHMMKTIEPGKTDLPWTGLVFGLSINAIWYWCTDQVIVQRTLASRNVLHAKAGCILGAYFKLTPMFVLVLPGMAARILFPDRVACSDPVECERICGSPGGCSNIAYVELVLNLMPTGLVGMMMAVMMSAIMSSLTSIFNSASTIFTIDIWTRFRKKASEREQIIVGRIFVAVIVIISVLWIPVIQQSGNSKLFDYINIIISYLASPICAVFVLAILWKRTNEQGAFWGLIIGLIVGLSRFIMEFSYPFPPCGYVGPNVRPWWIELLVDRVHYLHFSCILFLISITAMIVVSLLTPPLKEENLYRLTFWTRYDTRLRTPIDLENEIRRQDPEVESPTLHKDSSIHRGKENEYEMSSFTSDEVKNQNPWLTKFYDKEKKIVKMASDFLEENPKWSWIVDINAIICTTIAIFIWGFFA